MAILFTMSPVNHSYERCRAFIASNFVESPVEIKRFTPSVAISRKAYSQAHAIAEELITLMEVKSAFEGDAWTLFDRSLVERILEDHNLPKAMARYMPEDRDHDFTGLINEILGVHPSSWKLFHYTCDTIHKLAKIGGVILIGRGSHIITRGMPHVLKVRIIAPMEQRICRATKLLDIPTAEATRRVKQDDAARAAFVRSHFDEDVDDPLAYDLTINTGEMDARAAAKTLFAALRER
jgi:cytidylate kinase